MDKLFKLHASSKGNGQITGREENTMALSVGSSSLLRRQES